MYQLERQVRELRAQLGVQQRAQRAAEQRAQAERSLSLELEGELASRDQEALRRALGELAAAEERIRELEAELERLRRRIDEAEHLAAVSRVRARGRGVAPPGVRGLWPTLREERIVAERGRGLAIVNRAPARAPLPQAQLPAADLRVLRIERATRAHLIPGNQSAPDGEGDGLLDQRLRHTLAALRAELDQLRAGVERETAARSIATVPASEVALPVPEGLAEPVQADRLRAALARLREAPRAPDEGAPISEVALRPARGAPTGDPPGDWLARVFSRLAGADPEMAGQLLLALLPAHVAVHPEPFAYDLILGRGECVRVTVRAHQSVVELADSPRADSEVDFQVVGELASVARTVAAGRFRRRFGRGMAHVNGDKAAFAALCDLVRAPLSPRQLSAAGVRLEAPLALTVVSLMVDRSGARQSD